MFGIFTPNLGVSIPNLTDAPYFFKCWKSPATWEDGMIFLSTKPPSVGFLTNRRLETLGG